VTQLSFKIQNIIRIAFETFQRLDCSIMFAIFDEFMISYFRLSLIDIQTYKFILLIIKSDQIIAVFTIKTPIALIMHGHP